MMAAPLGAFVLPPRSHRQSAAASGKPVSARGEITFGQSPRMSFELNHLPGHALTAEVGSQDLPRLGTPDIAVALPPASLRRCLPEMAAENGPATDRQNPAKPAVRNSPTAFSWWAANSCTLLLSVAVLMPLLAIFLARFQCRRRSGGGWVAARSWRQRHPSLVALQ